jgi:hypothetical protein
METQGEQFTRAALRRVGENANRADGPTIDRAFARIGQQFDDLAARNTLRADQRLAGDLQTTVQEYFSVVNASQRAPIVEDTVREVYTALQRTGGTLAGDAYQSLRSRLDRVRRSTKDPELSQALGGLREALDGAMERSVSTADRAAWREARNQYRNMIVIEKAATGAGEKVAEGLISPSQLRNAVVQQNRRQYARGQGDFAELARAGEAVMKPLPQSGTAPRAAASGAMQVLGGFAGHEAAGLPGAALGVAAPAAAARTLMSRPVQGWLSNQTVAPALNAPIRGEMSRMLPPSISGSDQEATQSPMPSVKSLSDALNSTGVIKGQRAQYLAKKMLSVSPQDQPLFLKQVEDTYGSNVAKRLAETFAQWAAAEQQRAQ